MTTPKNLIIIKPPAKSKQGLDNFKAETETYRTRERVTIKSSKF